MPAGPIDTDARRRDDFARTAGDYDDARRRLIPCFDRFYGVAADALRDVAPLRRVLDLGAGTGLLTSRVMAAHGHANLGDADLDVTLLDVTLLDEVPEMLDGARARLGPSPTYVQATLPDGVPDGPFDAVVSALAIHHLSHSDKRRLFGRVAAVLRPGGIFVNAEQVAAPDPGLDAVQHQRWRAEATAAGATAAQLADAEDRMRADRCASVPDQLGWLRAAGFTGVDAPFRDGRFAVLVGRAPNDRSTSRP